MLVALTSTQHLVSAWSARAVWRRDHSIILSSITSQKNKDKNKKWALRWEPANRADLFATDTSLGCIQGLDIIDTGLPLPINKGEMLTLMFSMVVNHDWINMEIWQE